MYAYGTMLKILACLEVTLDTNRFHFAVVAMFLKIYKDGKDARWSWVGC
jgi:hypothetical protein